MDVGQLSFVFLRDSVSLWTKRGQPELRDYFFVNDLVPVSPNFPAGTVSVQDA